MTLTPVATMIAPPANLPAFLWPVHRQKCHACAHCRERLEGADSRDGGIVTMRCDADPTPRKSSGRNGGSRAGYCIDMRTDGKCGPDAVLFQPKKEAP